jgi:hypothetical protein
LRKSLTKQLVAAYIASTGKEKKLGLLGKTFADRADDCPADQRADL